MIKVSVLYPNEEGKKFDMIYYCDKHIPMCQEKLGCLQVAVEQGLAGGTPGTPAPYIAMGHLYFDSLEALQAAFEQHAAEIMADIPNYTEIAPVMQISEVKM
jgi:uncharacterized protein (TIGR02118 family)